MQSPLTLTNSRPIATTPGPGITTEPSQVSGGTTTTGPGQVDSPSNWPTKHPEYCSGSAQSPIDIETSEAITPSSDPGAITLTGYDAEMMAKIVNTGHTAKMTLEGPQPTISGGKYL